MTPSQRIAINTLATYGRTIFGMALGLFSGRWIFAGLGECDYGLFGVVGSVISMIVFFNAITSNAISRFFAFSIGKGVEEETAQWFNTAALLHTVIPFILIIIGYPFGAWVVREFLNIPPERLETCLWVFRFSCISAFVSMVSTPYVGMHLAKQRIAELAVWGLGTSVVSFGLAYYISQYKGDALLVYSAGQVAITVFFELVLVVRARHLYRECCIRFEYFWSQTRIKAIFAFAGATMISAVASMLRNQGTAILLNKYFNPLQFPAVNASYGIGNQLAGQCLSLSSALMGAFSPEITASEGRGDRVQMLRNAMRASKMGTSLILIFAVPLILEVDYILVIWLKNPPEYASFFCLMALFVFLVDKVAFGQMVAINAKGKIAAYQTINGLIQLMALPLALCLLKLKFSACAVMWSSLIIGIMNTIVRVIWAEKLVGAKITIWILQVLLPCSGVLLIGLVLGKGLQYVFPTPSFSRFLMVSCVSELTVLLVIWFGVFDGDEKKGIVHMVQNIVKRKASKRIM